MFYQLSQLYFIAELLDHKKIWRKLNAISPDTGNFTQLVRYRCIVVGFLDLFYRLYCLFQNILSDFSGTVFISELSG